MKIGEMGRQFKSPISTNRSSRKGKQKKKLANKIRKNIKENPHN